MGRIGFGSGSVFSLKCWIRIRIKLIQIKLGKNNIILGDFYVFILRVAEENYKK
jgi:hypothetical protein